MSDNESREPGNKPASEQRNESRQATTTADPWWTPAKKVAVSCLIVFHIFAVFAAPCASPPPSSDTWQRIAGRLDGQDGLLSPYLRAGYLNHGYRFFAPNPGPSHLVRFEIDLADGGQVKGQFPDREDQFPRLLYHRMFMLSETAFNLAAPVLEQPVPGSLNPQEQQEFDRQLAAADALAESISRQLLDQHAGKRVRLYLQTHDLPFPADVVAGQKLDDASLYQEQFWREVSADQLLVDQVAAQQPRLSSGDKNQPAQVAKVQP